MNKNQPLITITRLCGAAVLTILMLILSACVTNYPDRNRDPAKNNLATYRKDFKECQDDYPATDSGAYIRQWQGCMNLKGWQ